MIEETIVEQNWMKEELKELNNSKPLTGQVEGLRLEENKIYDLRLDTSKPWDKWVDELNNIVKKLIPVTYEGKPYIFWLNVANPLYKQLLEACANGQTEFKIIRNGTKKATRYNIIR